jgi:hypothetical protein
MIRSQHPLRIAIQTPKTILERPWLTGGASPLEHHLSLSSRGYLFRETGNVQPENVMPAD